jgi:AP-3 complex subunit delta-1
MYEAGIAMSGLSCFINGDLARDLANDIMSLVRNVIIIYIKKIFV